MMQNLWKTAGLLLCMRLSIGMAAPGGADLSHRCFVWHPERCTSKHKKLDDEMVKSVTRGFSNKEAAGVISKHAWELLLKKRKADAAIIRFNQALIVDSQSAEAWWGAGTAAAELGLTDDAETCLLRSLKIDPKQSRVHYNLARLYFSQARDLAKAEEAAKGAVQWDAKYADGHKLLALIQFQTNQFSLSKASYERAVANGGTPDKDFEVRLQKAMGSPKR